MSDQPNIAPAQTVTPDADASATLLAGDAEQNSETPPAAAAAEGGADGSSEGGDAGAGDASEGGDAGAGDAEEGGQNSPESYADFTLPEGSNMNEAALTGATELFKADGLSQEQAQKYVDLYASQVQAGVQGQVDAHNQLMNDWSDAAKSDSEFGGEKFNENIGIAKTAIDKFGTPELKEVLRSSGVGNNPEIIRMFLKIGKLTQEDNPGGGNPASEKKDRVSTLYPNS